MLAEQVVGIPEGLPGGGAGALQTERREYSVSGNSLCEVRGLRDQVKGMCPLPYTQDPALPVPSCSIMGAHQVGNQTTVGLSHGLGS